MTEYTSFELFKQALYDKRSISTTAFLELYEKLLLDRGDENSILHANRIKQYREEITNKRYLSELKKDFNSL